MSNERVLMVALVSATMGVCYTGREGLSESQFSITTIAGPPLRVIIREFKRGDRPCSALEVL